MTDEEWEPSEEDIQRGIKMIGGYDITPEGCWIKLGILKTPTWISREKLAHDIKAIRNTKPITWWGKP